MFTRLIAPLRALLSRRRALREADEELQFHIDQETAANIERGMTPAEARRSALRDLGGLTQTREAVRDVRASWVHGLLHDVRYSVATLRRSPAFAVTAVAVLALAIGVASAVFSIVNAVFFLDRGVARPAELVHVYQVLPRYGQTAILGEQHIELFERSPDVFTALAGYWAVPVPVSIGRGFGSLRGEQVTVNYFDVLGVRPALGRTFGPEEDDPATTEFATVISHDMWLREFEGTPDVIGRRLEMGFDYGEARVFTIVGVAPEGFRGLSSPWDPTQFWVPVRQYWGTTRPAIGLGVVGRLREGMTAERAHVALAVPYEQWWADRTRNAPPNRVRAPGASARRGPNPLRVLPFDDVHIPLDPDAEVIPRRLVQGVALVVALVLVVAMTNVTGIVRARGISRSGELAVRRALGAGLWRTVRQLTVESAMLSLVAGGAGLLLAVWLVAFYRAFTPDRLLVPVAIDFRVVAFAFVLAAIVAVVVSVGPAIQAMKVSIVANLGGGVGTTQRTRARLRHGVVIPQIAVTVLLLVPAVVHVRSLAATETTDTGYSVDDVQVVRLGLQSRIWSPGVPPSASEREREAERARRFYRLLEQRLRDIPGVRAAAIASDLPIRDRATAEQSTEYVGQDGVAAGVSSGALASSVEVSAGYFDTLRIPLVAGRDFEPADVRGAEPVAIVSQSVVDQLWPNGSAIGKSIAALRDDQSLTWLTVVGVVGDVSPTLRPDVARAIVYVPVLQQWWPSAYSALIDVRDGQAASAVAELSAEVTAIDPQAAVYGARPLRALVDELLYPRRAATALLVLCGVIGLILAGIGLYAVVSYSVAQRLREIAIRMAIGASRRDVASLVLREAAIVAALGALVGLPLSVSAVRFAASLIGPVAADAVAFAVVCGVVAAVTCAACVTAARRAVALDPASLLRHG